MPVKKRLPKTKQHRITPDAVAAFALCEAIRDAGEEETRADEYDEAWRIVYRELDLRPWLENPLDVDDEYPPDWMKDEHQRARWAEAWELRRALEEAAEK